MYVTWSKNKNGNPKDMYFSGTGAEFKKFVESMVEDFEEPKFGYNNELWDEED